MSEAETSTVGVDTTAVIGAMQRLSEAITAQTQMTLDTAVYSQNMSAAMIEQEGRASLARFVFSGSVSLGVIFAGAVYAAHNSIPIGLIIAKGLCLLGALFAAMSIESGNDRWKYEQIAAEMGTSVGSVKAHIFHAIKNLTRYIKGAK